MKGLSEYIEKELENVEYDKILLTFQKNLLEEGKETELRTKKAGLQDEGVLLDLFKSQHPDLTGEYAVFRKAELKKNTEKSRHKFLLIGSPIYFIIMIAVYLGVSFYTKNWAQSWLIIIGFVAFFVDSVGITLTAEIAAKRKLFHPIARVIMGLAVMMTASLIFLIGNTVFSIPRFWVVFPAGVIAVFIVDAIFAYCTKQMLRNINYLIYIVASAAMLYIVLGGLYIVPWNKGWLMIPLSLIIDIVYVAIRLINNSKYTYRPEDYE